VDEELHGHFNETLAAMGAFVSGRVTYELMAGFWPAGTRTFGNGVVLLHDEREAASPG
jgi:dihydrofolate reductase